MYIVPAFMVNPCTTYYGSQITAAMEEAGVDLHVNTDDMLMKAARGKSERTRRMERMERTMHASNSRAERTVRRSAVISN
jgi:hypothetical protein